MRKDGGPAFPTDNYRMNINEGSGPPAFADITSAGMSLRDWFAGQTLVGMLANPALLEAVTSEEIKTEKASTIVARYAYLYADAMLKERDK